MSTVNINIEVGGKRAFGGREDVVTLEPGAFSEEPIQPEKKRHFQFHVPADTAVTGWSRVFRE